MLPNEFPAQTQRTRDPLAFCDPFGAQTFKDNRSDIPSFGDIDIVVVYSLTAQVHAAEEQYVLR